MNSKIKHFYNNLTDKQILSLAILIATLITAITVIVYENKTAKDEELAENYTRAFGELVTYVNNIDAALGKVMLTGTPSKFISLAGEIYATAALAKGDLEKIPLTNMGAQNASKFLSQIGDYLLSLSDKTADGSSLREEDRETMLSLSGYSRNMRNTFNRMQSKLADGDLTLSALDRELSMELPEVKTDLRDVENLFSDFPTLIYDGPYSDHMQQKAPEMLQDNDARQITAAEACSIAAAFIGNKKAETQVTAEGYGNWETYGVVCKTPERRAYVEVTKTGGYVSLLLDSRTPSRSNISPDDAIDIAQDFLRGLGYNLKDRYYQRHGNLVQINFAAVQDEFTVYPDLIKVEVALDDGEITGYNAAGYLANHKARVLPGSLLSKDEIKTLANPALSVTNTGYAIIPLKSGNEAVCYEIAGTMDGRKYLVYIDVETGKEQDILLLLQDQNGTLTI